MTAVLSTQGLGYQYSAAHFWKVSETSVLQGIDLELAPNEWLGITGPSGSGKSTLAKCLLGLLKPTQGKVFFKGQALSQSSREQFLFRSEVQGIFQNFSASLDPGWKVGTQIEEVLKIHRPQWSKSQRKDWIKEVAAPLSVEDDLFQRLPKELSGGQRQRMALLRVMVLEPKVLILDEVTNQLDVLRIQALLDGLQVWRRERGLACIWITHQTGWLQTVVDRVVRIEKGRLGSLG